MLIALLFVHLAGGLFVCCLFVGCLISRWPVCLFVHSPVYPCARSFLVCLFNGWTVHLAGWLSVRFPRGGVVQLRLKVISAVTFGAPLAEGYFRGNVCCTFG